MENRFYSDFDTACLVEETSRPGEYRTVFQIHRDRILHTSAFRRLQGKTQVFLAGEYDFYRTRLTHSIEVSQIGRSLCSFLRKQSPHFAPDFHIDADLVEAVCLSHDLGHPPFGHAGERSLHRLMQPYGGFEGNAQTLRLLTETIFSSGTRGMNPSRALLDGVLKYKGVYGEFQRPEHHFIYDEQAHYLHFVNGGTPHPLELPAGPVRDAVKSIECQIMDWADDTAYSLNDIADGVQARFLTGDKLEAWAENAALSTDDAAHLTDLVRSIRRGRIETRSNKKIGDFITACSVVPRENFLSGRTNRHAFQLVIAPEARAESKLYKRIAYELVFQSPQLQQLDFKAAHILGSLFGALEERYIHPSAAAPALHLLPPAAEEALRQAGSAPAKARLLCDFLSRLTDHAATRLHKRLFDPDFGSIVDLL